METRANNALIGFFTLAVIAMALGFIVWFSRISESQALKRFEVDFQGSVTGLTVGSAVTFNGLRVGQVEALDLNPRNPAQVIAIIAIRDETPVKVDTSARLEFTGITGGANVQLYGGKPDAPDLVAPRHQKYAIISAQRSELQNLVDGARDTISQASSTMNRLDNWITQNENSLTSTVKNIETFTKALADNSSNVSQFLQDTGDAARSVSRLADSLNGMSGDLQTLLKSVSPEKIDHIVSNVSQASDKLASFASVFDESKARAALDNVEAFTKALNDVREPLSKFANNASSLTEQLNTMAPKLSTGLDHINRIAGAVDADKVNRIVADIAKVTGTVSDNASQLDQFIANARKISDDLAKITPALTQAVDNFNKVANALDPARVEEIVKNVGKFADALGGSSEKVKAIIADANQISQELKTSADRLDGIMNNIAAMTSGQDGKGMFNEITQTARAIRQLADNLDARTAVLAKNLNNFSGAGLREYQQLATDGQKTLQNIQRTLNSLQRNPQQMIFGPRSTIPDYRGK